MFDDEPPLKTPVTFPRNLEGLSVDELQVYIAELNEEIKRVEDDIERKKASQNAAAAFFK